MKGSGHENNHTSYKNRFLGSALQRHILNFAEKTAGQVVKIEEKSTTFMAILKALRPLIGL